MLKRPCLDCNVCHARPGQSRCFSCAAVKNHDRTAHRRAAPSTNAQQRVRRAINAVGYARCALCKRVHDATGIEVDHRLPLADGGTNTETNVQPLCKRCHVGKTSAENRARTQKVQRI
jgi:5-methylcytosine-specific restriction protein A